MSVLSLLLPSLTNFVVGLLLIIAGIAVFYFNKYLTILGLGKTLNLVGLSLLVAGFSVMFALSFVENVFERALREPVFATIVVGVIIIVAASVLIFGNKKR